MVKRLERKLDRFKPGINALSAAARMRLWFALAVAWRAGALVAPAAPRRRGLAVRAQVTEVVSEATSVPAALADLWALIADPPPGGARLALPRCAPLKDRTVAAAVFEHLEVCKDCCESFGTAVVAKADGADGILVQGRAVVNPYDFDDSYQDTFGLSPELAAIMDSIGGDRGVHEAAPASSADLDDDATVLRLSKDWVNAVVSDAGICPFSLSADRAGLPIGDVRYDVSRAAAAEGVFAWYWRELDYLITTRTCATSLLVLADAAWLTGYEAFENVGAALAQALQTGTEAAAVGLGLEAEVQLVFFHPRHVFRDGADRGGADAAANYARRSPYLLPVSTLTEHKDERFRKRF